MSDQSSASAPPAPPAPPAPTGRTSADVAYTALHYAAGAALVAAVGVFAWYGKVSTDLFVALITAAGGAIGIKMSSAK